MTVAITSPDRVLWPGAGFTKGDMVAYYERVAPALLPHLADRALTLGRFPGGVDAPGFAQTECRGRPEWMTTRAIRLRDGRVREYCVVNDRRSLLWVGNQSAIELHPFLARGARHDQPTHVVFDPDPGPGAGVLECCRVALRLRELLDDLGLASFAKTSGSVGVHVLVPLNTPVGYEQTKPFAREVAARLAAEDPARVTARTRRSERAGRVLVDWLGNDASRSTVAAYSLRATDLPTASTPLAWDEVERADDERALLFTATDVLRRLDVAGDPLAPALDLRQRLPA
ncbi:MAG TPA: non-homologous end-joining DNA ligase [Solirubrobacteraceae bacterium]|nr:non-homologous end-joining DNA ligase [Solirubrobacteraceae bacterium]